MIAASLVSLLLAAPVAGAAPGSAARCEVLSGAQVRERVEGLLRAIDVEVAPDAWRTLGAQAIPALEAVVADRQALPTRRARALWGLVHVAGRAAGPVLAARAADAAEAPAVRRAAVRGLAAVAPGGLGGGAGTGAGSDTETTRNRRGRPAAERSKIAPAEAGAGAPPQAP